MLESFLTGIASNLASELLAKIISRIGSAALGGKEREELRECFQRAFLATLRQTAAHLDRDNLKLLGSIWSDYIDRNKGNVDKLLVEAALMEEPAPLAELQAAFYATGFDQSNLEIDFDTAISVFVESLRKELRAAASRPDSTLYQLVSMRLLLLLRADQRNQLTLLEQVLSGQDDAKAQLATYISQIDGRLEDIRRLLNDFSQLAPRAGIKLLEGANGSVFEIGNNESVTVPDSGRLARWWEEIGPDPDMLLDRYLRDATRAFATLNFPLLSLPKPILLKDVYIAVPIVKPPNDEDYLRPRRPGEHVAGERVPRVDDLISQEGCAALVGMMGMGKTSTLRYLSWLYASRPETSLYWRVDELVPFYAPLRNVAELWLQDATSANRQRFMRAMSKAVSQTPGVMLGAHEVERALIKAFEDGNALILLDALDEFHTSEAGRREFVEHLQALWSSRPFAGNYLLLTSRPYGFLNPGGFGQYLLQNPDQDVRNLVDRLGRAILYALDKPEEVIVPWLRELSTAITSPRLVEFWSPFYVTLMVYLGTRAGSAGEGVKLLNNINRLTDLYWFFLTKTIQWEKSKPGQIAVDFSEDEAMLVLAYAGFHTVVEPKGLRLADEIANSLQIHPSREDAVSRVNSILRFWLRSGLLFKDTFRPHIGFWHTGFQSFAVAMALSDMLRHGQGHGNKVRDLQVQYAADSDWEPIWSLYAGLLAGIAQ